MALATLCLTGVFISMKLLYNDSTIQPFEVSYFNGLGVLLLKVSVLKGLKEDPLEAKKEVRKLLLIRLVFGFISNFMNMTGV